MFYDLSMVLLAAVGFFLIYYAVLSLLVTARARRYRGGFAEVRLEGKFYQTTAATITIVIFLTIFLAVAYVQKAAA